MREDILYEGLAKDLGYTVKKGRTEADSMMFIKGAVHIWECVHRGNLVWQCADLLEGRYQNHRPYILLKDALTTESDIH